MNKKCLIPSAALATALLGGCAASPQFNQSQYQTGLQQQNVKLGTVLAVRSVTGQGGHTLGQLAGGGAGAALGNTIGSGLGRNLATLATLGGGLAGALAGGKIQQQATATVAHLITVRLHSGRDVAVTETGTFQIGERVQVVYQGKTVRVFPMGSK